MDPNFFQKPIVLVADIGEARNILLSRATSTDRPILLSASLYLVTSI